MKMTNNNWSEAGQRWRTLAGGGGAKKVNCFGSSKISLLLLLLLAFSLASLTIFIFSSRLQGSPTTKHKFEFQAIREQAEVGKQWLVFNMNDEADDENENETEAGNNSTKRGKSFNEEKIDNLSDQVSSGSGNSQESSLVSVRSRRSLSGKTSPEPSADANGLNVKDLNLNSNSNSGRQRRRIESK